MPTQNEPPARREATGMTTKGRASLRATIRHVQTRNADVDLDELQSLIDEEVAQARTSFWTQTRK